MTRTYTLPLMLADREALKRDLKFTHYYPPKVAWARSKRCMAFGVTLVVQRSTNNVVGQHLCKAAWNHYYGEWRIKNGEHKRSLPLIGEVIGIATW